MDIAKDLGRSFLRHQPVAAARVLEKLSRAELGVEIQDCDAGELVPAFEVMANSAVLSAFSLLPESKRGLVLELASPRLAMLIFDGIEEDQRAVMLAQLPPAIAEDLTRLMQYAPDSAGRMMDRPFETVRIETSVDDLCELLRNSTLRRARSVYVVDDQNRLAGRVDMQALALADEFAGFKSDHGPD